MADLAFSPSIDGIERAGMVVKLDAFGFKFKGKSGRQRRRLAENAGELVHVRVDGLHRGVRRGRPLVQLRRRRHRAGGRVDRQPAARASAMIDRAVTGR